MNHLLSHNGSIKEAGEFGLRPFHHPSMYYSLKAYKAKRVSVIVFACSSSSQFQYLVRQHSQLKIENSIPGSTIQVKPFDLIVRKLFLVLINLKSQFLH